VETEEQIQVGVTATVNGNPAEGKYVMSDGRTFVFAAGTLTEIMESEPENKELIQENETLKAENDSLKSKVAEIQASLDEKERNISEMKTNFETEIKNIQNKLDSFLSKFPNEKIEDNLPPVNTEKKGFSWKKKV